MSILPESISKGGKYITEENSLGYSQIKEVLNILPNTQDTRYDVIEYRAKTIGSTAPWMTCRCMRKTFAGNVARYAEHAVA